MPEAALGALIGALAFALYALACARLTRLVTTDTIIDRPRAWITERADARTATRPIAALIDCKWCVSVWIAAAVAGLDGLAAGPLAALVALWRALAALVADALGAAAPTAALDPAALAALAWAVIIAALAQAAGMLAERT